MKRPELVAQISENAEITKKAASLALDALVECIRESLCNEKGRVRIPALGTFRVVEKSARRGVNPRTGQEMTIPGMKLPRFTPAKALKDLVKPQE